MTLHSLYHRVIGWSRHPKATWLLAVIAFLESSIFPVPPDALLLPMGLANPDRAYRYAAIATIGSVLGGMLGYFLGLWFFETLGGWIIRAYHLEQAMESYRQSFAEWGVWVILAKGFTPIPYKLVTIASGIAQFNLGIFIAASIVTRGGRFFLISFLLRHFGDRARDFIEKRLTFLLWGFLILLIGGFLVAFAI